MEEKISDFSKMNRAIMSGENINDYVVIGGGTVGLFLSVLLAENGFKVTCIESGGYSFNSRKQNLNDCELSGAAHTGVSDARARVVGGTSTLWGGQLAEFSTVDFERFDNNNRKLWPISAEEIKPWYKMVAKYFDIGVYDKGEEHLLNKIYGVTAEQDSDIEFYLTYWLRVPNIYQALKKKLVDSGVVLIENCHAINLISNELGNVTDISIIEDTRGRRTLKSKVFILANGTLEISRLLLYSGIQDKNCGWKNNNNIGRYFHDHIDTDCGRLKIIDRKLIGKYFENSVIDKCKIQPKIRINQNRLEKINGLNIAGSLRFESDLEDDINYLKTMVKSFIRRDFPKNSEVFSLVSRTKGLARVWWPLVWNYLKNKKITAFFDKGVFLRVHMEHERSYESAITLSPSQRDSYGVPLLDLHWTIDWQKQLDCLVDFSNIVDVFFRNKNLAILERSKFIIEKDISGLIENSRDSFHQCGGASMGFSSSSAVTDANCKVFGTNNLYIAGAALFPTASYANPTFTAMALAYRLSDYLTRLRKIE